MKKKSITLYLLMCSPVWMMAQTYVAPPPLLPNPAYSNNNSPSREPVYVPETNNNLNNTYVPNPGSRTHLVKKGESLYRIAKMYNVTIDDIKAWNYLQSDVIAAGANLSIGSQAAYQPNNMPAQFNQMGERAVPGWLAGNQNHTLLAGESLAAIANYYGLTEARLRSMNNLQPQDPVPAGFVLNVNPCLSNPPFGNNPPGATEQINANGNYTTNGLQDYNSPVPKFAPQDRFAANNTNAPSSYDYSGNSANNSGNYNFRPEDQFGTNSANSSAIPNSYEYSSRGEVSNNGAPTLGTPGALIYENGRRVHVVGSYDTLETIADQYKLSADQLRTINRMGAYDVVQPNQKLQLE